MTCYLCGGEAVEPVPGRAQGSFAYLIAWIIP